MQLILNSYLTIRVKKILHLVQVRPLPKKFEIRNIDYTNQLKN